MTDYELHTYLVLYTVSSIKFIFVHNLFLSLKNGSSQAYDEANESDNRIDIGNILCIIMNVLANNN